MKNRTLILICLLSLCLIYSNCDSNGGNDGGEEIMPEVNGGGVVLTFDDAFVDQWYDCHQILQKYNWKATFFVAHFNNLSGSQVAKLKTLKNGGHEIAGHGLNHVDAKEYIAAHGMEDYVNDEIYAMKDLMETSGFYITAFAYPYGVRTSALDARLLDEFKIIRATTYTYGEKDPQLLNCYYTGSRLVYALGIDNSYGLTIEDILSILQYAREENKIAVFYSHKPVETVEGDYQTEYQRLKTICEYVINNGMKFYHISDLYDLDVE